MVPPSLFRAIMTLLIFKPARLLNLPRFVVSIPYAAAIVYLGRNDRFWPLLIFNALFLVGWCAWLDSKNADE